MNSKYISKVDLILKKYVQLILSKSKKQKLDSLIFRDKVFCFFILKIETKLH